MQHLKTKFGGTYLLEIKIPTACHVALTAFIAGKFSSAVLLEEPWQVLQRRCSRFSRDCATALQQADACWQGRYSYNIATSGTSPPIVSAC